MTVIVMEDHSFLFRWDMLLYIMMISSTTKRLELCLALRTTPAECAKQHRTMLHMMPLLSIEVINFQMMGKITIFLTRVEFYINFN